MKRLISSCIIVILLFSSCDSPLNNVEHGSQQPALTGNVAPTISYSTETVQPDSARKAAWQAFRAQNGSDWRIRWNEHTGLPLSIFLGKTEKTYSGRAEQAARAFLSNHRGLFGMKSDLTDLVHKTTSENPYGLRRVTFQQQYKGIPVEGGEYIVHIHSDGRVGMANGYYYPNIEVSSSPSISSEQAISTAKSDRELTNPSGESHSAELVVYLKEDGSFALAWKTIIFAEQPSTDWLYYIDAGSGAVIEKHSRIMKVTGTGNVYPTHPGLSSVTSTDLYRLSGNGTLNGTYVDVVNDEGSDAYSANHDFTYSTSSSHFDEVNLYYHVDDFRHNFISGLEYPGDDLDFIQITAHAHATHSDPQVGDVNAWFSRGNQHINFGDASSSADINNFAREDLVIYHEYSHAIIYDVESGISTSEGGEEGAISEGVPDYFAGSHTGRSLSGDYVYANYPQEQRDMTNPEYDHYDELPTDGQGDINVDPYPGGEFFSAILWDLRGSMSTTAVDFLVYEALHGVTGDPTFLEFRDAMVTADQDAYSGNNVTTIMDTFEDWGVITPVTVTISGSTFLDHGQQGNWTANAQDGSGSYSYQWYYKSTPTDSWHADGTDSDSYSNIFYNNSSQLQYSSVKVVVTSGSDQAQDVQSVTVQPDCGFPCS